jgi:hypothetical protein
VQPQLWAIKMMNATNIVFDNIYVNATSPEAPKGINWVQNTDGFSKSRSERKKKGKRQAAAAALI